MIRRIPAFLCDGQKRAFRRCGTAPLEGVLQAGFVIAGKSTPVMRKKKAQCAGKKLIIPFPRTEFPLGKFKVVLGLFDPFQASAQPSRRLP